MDILYSSYNRRSKACNQGYTIIEVSLSLTFIAFIIIFLTASMLSIIGTYNKGVWLSQVNQALRQMNQDIADTAKYGGLPSVKTVDGKVTRLCVNHVTYAWNLQSWINGADASKQNRFEHESGGSTLRLVRFNDDNGAYCDGGDKVNSDIPRSVAITDSDSGATLGSEATQILLSKGTILQKFDVDPGSEGKPLLSITGVVSTEGINAPVQVKLSGSKYVPGSGDDPWMCGDLIDNNGNNRFDSGDEFRPSKGEFCAKANVDLKVYERGVVK